MTTIALDEGPGDYRFETRDASGAKVTICLNVIECSAAVVASGVETSGNVKHVEEIVAVLRPLVYVEPTDAVVPASRVYAKYLEAEVLYERAGKEREPSRT